MAQEKQGIIELQLHYLNEEICSGDELSSSENEIRELLLEMYNLNETLGGGRRNSVDRIDQDDPEYWDTLVTSQYWRGYCDNRYFDEIRTHLETHKSLFSLQSYHDEYEEFWGQYEEEIAVRYSDEIKFHPELATADIAGDRSLSRILIYDPENEELIYKIFEPTKIGSKLVQGLEELSQKTAFHQPELFLYLLTGYPITSPRWTMKRKSDSKQGEFIIETFAENVSLNDFKEMYRQKNEMREADRLTFLLEKDLVVWRAMKKVQQNRKMNAMMDRDLSGTQEKLWDEVLTECKDQGMEDWEKADTVKSRWWKMQDRLPGRVELDSDNRLTFV